MKIIEIKSTPSGREVAYLFDERNNRVIKMFVEDYTISIDDRAPDGDTRDRYERDEVVPARPRRRTYIEDNNEPEEGPAEPRGGRELPLKTPSIIPPGIMSTMIQPGSPGAAEERRTV